MKAWIRRKILENYSHIPDILIRPITPRILTLEPIAGCNVQCKACPSNILKRPYGKMSYRNFLTIMNKIPQPKKTLLYFMGEPFLNEDIFKMVRYLEDRGIYTSISTNCTTLKKHYEKIIESGLSELYMCLDGFSQETIEQYRKGIHFDDIIEGIKRISIYREEKKSKTKLYLSTLVFKHNEHEIGQIKAFAQKYKLDKYMGVYPILDDWGGKKTENLETVNIWNRLPPMENYCRNTLKLVVTWDGLLLPCCYDVHAEMPFGNLLKDDFESIYWSLEGRKFRERIAMKKLDICNGCPMANDSVRDLYERR